MMKMIPSAIMNATIHPVQIWNENSENFQYVEDVKYVLFSATDANW